VARGDVSQGSDIDLLFVVEGLSSGYLDRVTFWAPLEAREDVAAEKRRLRQAGRGAELSWILLSPEEARRLRLLYLDVCQEGVLLLDRESFFSRILEGVRREMERAQARRHPAGAGWYWTFRQDLRVGAEVG
jgi:predicted nucleotidyltransferase